LTGQLEKGPVQDMFDGRCNQSDSAGASTDTVQIWWLRYTTRWGAHCCRLANTSEPSVCGGDAALR